MKMSLDYSADVPYFMNGSFNRLTSLFSKQWVQPFESMLNKQLLSKTRETEINIIFPRLNGEMLHSGYVI